MHTRITWLTARTHWTSSELCRAFPRPTRHSIKQIKLSRSSPSIRSCKQTVIFQKELLHQVLARNLQSCSRRDFIRRARVWAWTTSLLLSQRVSSNQTHPFFPSPKPPKRIFSILSLTLKRKTLLWNLRQLQRQWQLVSQKPTTIPSPTPLTWAQPSMPSTQLRGTRKV